MQAATISMARSALAASDSVAAVRWVPSEQSESSELAQQQVAEAGMALVSLVVVLLSNAEKTVRLSGE